MQKIRKILRAVSEKPALHTNQTTNHLLPTRILQDLAGVGTITVSCFIESSKKSSYVVNDIVKLSKIKNKINIQLGESVRSLNLSPS